MGKPLGVLPVLSNDPPSYTDSTSTSRSSTSCTPVTSRNPPPIQRSSSSSLLRQKPHVPSAEQQRHIASAFGNAPVLSAISSGARTEYFDVLPSFQMFQSILKRDDSQFSENLSVNPPVYGDTLHSSATPPQPRNEYVEMELVSRRLAELSNDDTLDEPVIPRNNYGHTVLDNIDRLQKVHSSPIDIQIFVAKDVPQPHVSNELETRLKEYTSGDLVNGWIIITNKSDKPVDFGLFTVSLEGTVKATERDTSVAAEFTMRKFKKVLIRKFLKMYDLNASYGYAHVPNSAGIEYEAYSTDQHDGCVLGLPNERVLQPHVQYKKFFTFRFPSKLLDNNCLDDIFIHNCPPPSVGFDRTCFYNRGDSVQLNKALGYGFLNVRGTPLLTRDYSFENISVSYTIEAKFIDKVGEDKALVTEHEINLADSEANYVIAKHNQYFLRFIPDLRQQIKYYNQGYHFLTSTFGTLGIDGKLFQNIVQLVTWRSFNELNQQIENEIDVLLTSTELSEEQIKHKNLLDVNQDFTSKTHRDIDSKERVARQVYYDRGESDELDELARYQDRRMVGLAQIAVFGKKRKSILLSLVRIGSLKLYVGVPHQILPYCSPKLLMKYNSGGDEMPDDTSLRPVLSALSSSNMLEIYNRDAMDSLLAVDIELVFEADSSSTQPPHISSIETNLILWLFNTEYPLPVVLEYDFFYHNPHATPRQEHVDDVELTRQNLQHLKDQASNYINFLRANKTFISKKSYLYLKAIRTLGIKKDTIKDYFMTLTNKHDDIINAEGSWKPTQLPNHKIRWVKKLSVPLHVLNKNNITLIPSFQNCLVGRLYCLQVQVKYKGSGGEQNEFADNIVKVDVPLLVG